MAGPRVYGVTLKGEPCKRCLKQNGYCYQHTHQAPRTSSSTSSSSYSPRSSTSPNFGGGGHSYDDSGRHPRNEGGSGKVYGYTQQGLPCKICIQQGRYCHFHKYQEPARYTSGDYTAHNTRTPEPPRSSHRPTSSSNNSNNERQEHHRAHHQSSGDSHYYGYYSNENSPPPPRSPPRPSSTKTFGKTQDGNPCLTCILQGKYCHQHKDQYRDKLKKRGDKLYDMGEYEKAAKYYGTAAQVQSPSFQMGRIHAVLYDRRAGCWMKLQRYEDAIQDWTLAISIFPTYCNSWKKRGRCQYKNMGMIPAAINDLETWLRYALESRCDVFSMEDIISDYEIETVQFELRELKRRQAHSYTETNEGPYGNSSHQYSGFNTNFPRNANGRSNQSNGSRPSNANTGGSSSPQAENNRTGGSNSASSGNTSRQERWSGKKPSSYSNFGNFSSEYFNTSSSNNRKAGGGFGNQSRSEDHTRTRNSNQGTSWQSRSGHSDYGGFNTGNSRPGNSNSNSSGTYSGFNTGNSRSGDSNNSNGTYGGFNTGNSRSGDSNNSNGTYSGFNTGNSRPGGRTSSSGYTNANEGRHYNTSGSKPRSTGSNDRSSSSKHQEDVMDHYKALGVTKDATLSEIKKAHRKLALQFHPDKNKESGSAEKFRRVQEAYEVLREENSRRRYDLEKGYPARQ